MRVLPLLVVVCSSLMGYHYEILSDEEEGVVLTANSSKTKTHPSRKDQIPEGRLKEETASYLEGYIQALIDANYYELNVLVYVNKDRVVFLYNLPSDER